MLFKPAVWAAFMKNLSPDTYRFIERSSMSRFHDSGENESNPDYVKIDSEYLFSNPFERRQREKIQDNILSWANANDISVEELLAEERFESPKSDVDNFLRGLGNLDNTDLARVSVPLDVILKALSKGG